MDLNMERKRDEIKDTDEVIELDTESFISKAQSIVKQPPFDIPNQKIVSIEPVPVATKSADVKAITWISPPKARCLMFWTDIRTSLCCKRCRKPGAWRACAWDWRSQPRR